MFLGAWWWRRLIENHRDQLLRGFARTDDVDAQSQQQRQADRALNEHDRDERQRALARTGLKGGGHRRPLQRLARVVAAAMGSQGPVDRAAGNHAADCPDSRTKQAVTNDAGPGDCTGNAADNLAGRGR